ncbi:MAG: beta-glucosidase [Actinomycetota bacterium]
MNPDLPAAVDEADLASRLTALTLEQKVRLVTGADFWTLYPEPAAGLRRMVLSDGPAGVRGETWDERDPSVNVPTPTALAASWDGGAIERLGHLLAAEARRKGVDVLLAPTVNLHRTPYGGRHFECLSEDPFLTAQLGAAYVRGVQAGGVGATVKHFVANDSETERRTLNARIAERPLRELYLAPFETIVREAGAWSVMASYNAVNGPTMTESPLLRDVLQDEWGFDGLTMSDWSATRSTVAAGNAGLDLAMPGPMGPWGDALVAAVRAGDVAEAAVDDKVRRILRLAARVGALEGIPAAVAEVPVFSGDDAAALVRAQAAAGTVLTKNDGVLPLAPESLARVALIGPNALVVRTLGGGSATVSPPYTVSPAEGLVAALGGDVQLDVTLGARSSSRTAPAAAPWSWRADGQPGAEVRFLAADGTEIAREDRTGGAYNWMSGIGVDGVASIEVHATVRATEGGTYEIGGSGLGRFRLTLDGIEVFDQVVAQREGADIVEAMMIPPQVIHRVELTAGQQVQVVLTHDVAHTPLGGGREVGPMIQFNVQPAYGSDAEEIARAVDLAAAADVAVVVVGTTEEVESEGFDRTSLALPGAQDELVRAVAAANPHTVVVVNAGAPVLLPWVDDVAAVLLVWFPGQEAGNALADVLFGAVEPGGRLPVTWPAVEDGLPGVSPVDGQLPYDEGLFIGYRWYEKVGRTPAFSFGHGLGYTDWEYLGISTPQLTDSGDLSFTVRVRNVGERPGREVVQVYASRPGSAVERAARWLAGFAVVDAVPGEEVDVAVTVPRRTLEHWDEAAHAWALEAGTFVLEAGRSSGDLRVRGEVAVA